MYKWRCSSESIQLNVWQWRRGSIDWQAKLCKWRWSIAVLRRCAKMYNPTAAWTTWKEKNANIEFKCYLVRVCVRLEVTTFFIGQKNWAKEVCNQQTKICEHCSVALSCNIQVCGFLVANLSVCDILAAEPPWIARNYTFLSRTTWTII